MMWDPASAIAPLTDPPTKRVHTTLWVVSDTRATLPARVPTKMPFPITSGEVSTDEPSDTCHALAPVRGFRAIKWPFIVANRSSCGCRALEVPGNPVSAGDAATDPPSL